MRLDQETLAMDPNEALVVETHSCFHCGEVCDDETIKVEDHTFCCQGCKLVYQLLDENGLSHFYSASDENGVGRKPDQTNYSFLDNEEVVASLLQFTDGEVAKFTLELPSIHCISCIWLLENLNRLVPGIKQSRVDYLKKQCSILYNVKDTNLRQIIEILSSIGYPPRLNLDQVGQSGKMPAVNRSLYYKLGVAGFCFGNIMLLSFPEYLGLKGDATYTYLGYFNILLALPVVFYAGIDYLKSAMHSLRRLELGIDLPIAIGMIVLFGRSVVELLWQLGEGYLDSLAGFVFFLLIGKWFQQRSFDAIHFDRDYRSFFPISVQKRKEGNWQYESVKNLIIGDIIKVHHGEIIPCDAILMKGDARIDYSFVTGEEHEQHKIAGDHLYAGGRQMGSSIELTVCKQVDQSYLTQLWNQEIFQGEKGDLPSELMDRVSQYFVLAILLISAGTFLYWWPQDLAIALKATTAVLIISCPCVLALSVPFIYGNMMRILARVQIYCRNTAVMEKVSDVSHILFDKTGTLTDLRHIEVMFEGEPLKDQEIHMVQSLTGQSNHLLSRAIHRQSMSKNVAMVSQFQEHVGKGIEGKVEGFFVRMGSADYILQSKTQGNATEVLLEINGHYRGRYVMKQALRRGIVSTIRQLSKTYVLQLVSGDNDNDRIRMSAVMGETSPLFFDQKPQDKLDLVKKLQAEGRRTMMIGDGLNDAGALRQSDVGMVISQQDNSFSPACDIIISSDAFLRLGDYIAFIRGGRVLLKGAIGLSLIYNSVGLFFATTGQLSPVVAAILMPISSLTVMTYGLLSTEILYRLKLRSEPSVGL